MAVNQEYLSYITDQLQGFGEFETKSMFGGIGIFRDGLMFAMIAGDTFKLKVDESNKADFQEKGMEPHHDPKKKKGMPYWAVPEEVVEDRAELAKWAEKAFQAALKAKK